MLDHRPLKNKNIKTVPDEFRIILTVQNEDLLKYKAIEGRKFTVVFFNTFQKWKIYIIIHDLLTWDQA